MDRFALAEQLNYLEFNLEKSNPGPSSLRPTPSECQCNQRPRDSGCSLCVPQLPHSHATGLPGTTVHVPPSPDDWTRIHCEYVTGNGRYVGQRPGTRVDSGSCSPQATWACALQGAPRLAAVLAPGQRRLAPRDAAHNRFRPVCKSTTEVQPAQFNSALRN